MHTDTVRDDTPALGPLLHTLERLATGGDAALQALRLEVPAYPEVQTLRAAAAMRRGPAAPELLPPGELDLPGGRVAPFTTPTTFGTAHG